MSPHLAGQWFRRSRSEPFRGFLVPGIYLSDWKVDMYRIDWKKLRGYGLVIALALAGTVALMPARPALAQARCSARLHRPGRAGRAVRGQHPHPGAITWHVPVPRRRHGRGHAGVLPPLFGLPMPDVPRQSASAQSAAAATRSSRAAWARASSSRPTAIIMTNAHVVDGADEVIVTLTDKREFKAHIVGVGQAHRRRRGEDRGDRPAGGEDRRRQPLEGRRMGHGHRLALRSGKHGDGRHRQCQAARHRRLPAFHPDRRGHQPRQFGRPADQHARRGGGHQQPDLLALRRLSWASPLPSRSTRPSASASSCASAGG